MPAKFKQQNTQRVFLLLGCCCYLHVYFFCVGVIFNIAKYTVVQDVHCWVHSYFHLENWLNKKSRVLKLVNLENCLFIVDKRKSSLQKSYNASSFAACLWDWLSHPTTFTGVSSFHMCSWPATSRVRKCWFK